MVVAIAFMINNELEAPIPADQNQERIRKLRSFRFSPTQLKFLNGYYDKFHKRTGGHYENLVFAKRYLLEMVVKDLNRNIEIELTDDSPQQEYDFFMAYLLVIDEANQRVHLILKQVEKITKDEFTDYRMIWTPSLNQFQYNEKSAVPYEMYKVACFLIYAFKNLRPYLKEYLNNLGLSSIGMLLGSFYQIVASTLIYNEKNSCRN